jgi:hypothetical protein
MCSRLSGTVCFLRYSWRQSKHVEHEVRVNATIIDNPNSVPNVARPSADCVRCHRIITPDLHNFASGMAASPFTSGSWRALRILSSVTTYDAGMDSAFIALFSTSSQSCRPLAVIMSRATCIADRLAFGIPSQVSSSKTICHHRE